MEEKIFKGTYEEANAAFSIWYEENPGVDLLSKDVNTAGNNTTITVIYIE